MNYRSDIQILRGVAVAFVVLFHFGFSSLQSGFLGVDIFFVISGFLMAVLYNNSYKVEFYIRRAKRLLPAYYVVIFFTLVFSYLVTTPNETEQVITQVKYASVFSSNVGFWMQNSYFSKSEFNPLLHLWSLGVEIQFYLIVPILYWMFSKNKYMYLLALLSSLVLCFMIVGISPKTSFFMLPLRLWEFLIGYGAAHYFTNKGALKVGDYKWLGLCGLITLCVIPFFSVNGESLSAINGHPGLFALLVSVATALVLIFGLPTFIENLKFSKLLERTGKYSYSIYLVHFPIIVIYLSEPFTGTNLSVSSFKDGFTLLILIALSSIALYYFVESKKINFSMKKLVIGASVSLLLLSVILPLVQAHFSVKKEKLIFGAFSDRTTYRCGKLIRVLEPTALSCDLTPNINNPKQRVMLVGNSHSDSIKATFLERAQLVSSKLFFMVPNDPLMTDSVSAKDVIDDAVSKKVNKLVLHYKSFSISNGAIFDIVSLSEKANIKVFFIEPVPIWSINIPGAMYQNFIEGAQTIEKMTNLDYANYNLKQLDFVRSIESKNFTTVSVVEYFCNPECEYSNNNGAPLYFDSHHLTITGSSRLRSVFDNILLK